MHQNAAQRLFFLQIIEVNAVAAARGVHYFPSAHTYAHMGDTPLTVIIAKEKQVAGLAGWLQVFGLDGLHVSIAREFDPHPVVQKARKPGTIDAVAGGAAPQIGHADHALGIQQYLFTAGCIGLGRIGTLVIRGIQPVTLAVTCAQPSFIDLTFTHVPQKIRERIGLCELA